jgi:hypothetical protein
MFPPTPCFLANNPGYTTQGNILMDINGYVNIHNANATSQLILGHDGANNLIESETPNTSAPGDGLLVNYYCGRNTAINTGVNGGDVALGKRVYAMQSFKIGYDPLNTPIDMNTAINIHQDAANSNALRINCSNTSVKALLVEDYTTPVAKTNFLVMSNGVTQIGGGQSLSPNKMLTVNGDVLFANNGVSNPANQYNGYSGFEIVGGNRVPDRRGISVNDDPNGDFNFFINSYQSNGYPLFRFKNGIANGVPATTASAADDLFTLSVFGEAKLFVYGTSSGVKDVFTITDKTFNKVNYKVKSNGYVFAREINIMPTNINFPDYVFAKNYRLMSIADLSYYVTENKHLPNIPSAKEVEKNGINVSEMQIKQMEKIEEAFLYIIQLKEENELLKARLSVLENAKN